MDDNSIYVAGLLVIVVLLFGGAISLEKFIDMWTKLLVSAITPPIELLYIPIIGPLLFVYVQNQ